MWHYTWWNNIKLWSYAKTTSRLSRRLQKRIKNEQEEANQRQKTYLIPFNWIKNKPKGIDKIR